MFAGSGIPVPLQEPRRTPGPPARGWATARALYGVARSGILTGTITREEAEWRAGSSLRRRPGRSFET